jgi:hypothetical protein
MDNDALGFSMTGRLALGTFTHGSRRMLVAIVLLALLVAAAFSARLLLGAGSQPFVAGAGVESHSGLLSLPPAARASISSALGADEGAYHILSGPGGVRASNPAQDLSAAFASSKLVLSSRTLTLGISLRAVGFGSSVRAVELVRPTAYQNRVTYSHTGLSEWYVNGPLGIEQGFTVARAPVAGADGPLTLAMTLSGDARLALGAGGTSATISAAGARALRYGGVSATDARGRALPAWLTLAGRELTLHVGLRDARFPVEVDPTIEDKPEAKLTPKQPDEHSRFGMSVALSGDGKTALVGAPWENGGTGGAWVFTRGEEGWVQSGPMLTIPAADSKIGDCGTETAEEVEEIEGGETGGGSEETADECRFARAVAVDGDGGMLVIGAPRAHSDAGAVWIYTRSGSTWTETSELLSPAGGKGAFGRSVAVSSDGETVLVGAPQSGTGGAGEAWVFAHDSSGWQPAGPLDGQGTANEGSFGRSVALSANGEAALVGAPGLGQTPGAAWVFSGAGGSWSGSGAALTGGGAAPSEVGFGSSVALSAEGSTALVGAPAHNGDVGAAWVFTNPGSGWGEPGSMLTGAGAPGEEFGHGVALSADGTHALVGAAGAAGKRGDALLFVNSGEGWGTPRARLIGGKTESGSALFGTSVALSLDGETMLAGGRADDKSGAAWVFGPYPSVTGIWPDKGPAGTVVEIKGQHIDDATSVRFGSNEAASFTVEKDNANGEEIIMATSPRGIGTVHITVETPVGVSSRGEEDVYKYLGMTKEGGGGGGGGGTGGSGPAPPNPGGTPAPGAGVPETGGAVGVSAGSVLAFGPAPASTCTVSLVSKKVAVQPHSLALFKLRGTGSAKCSGKLKLMVKRWVTKKKYKTKVIGAASFSLAPGKNVAVKVKLNAAGRALLRAGHGRLSANLLLAKSLPTPAQAHTASVRLTQQKPHPPKKPSVATLARAS